MILAKKVRLIPTPEQEKVLRNHALVLQDLLITIVKE